MNSTKEIDIDNSLSILDRYLRIPSFLGNQLAIQDIIKFLKKIIIENNGKFKLISNLENRPIVYALFESDYPKSKTLLFYDHYDVLDGGNVDEWNSNPFIPLVKDDILYARGVADNKGSLIQRLTAVTYLKRQHKLHCNVKFLIEGEEELGSQHIESCLINHHDLFKCDACIWEFGSRDIDDDVEIFAGVKGLIALELTCKTALFDIHAMYGGVIEGAAERLGRALSTLKNNDGHIQIDGFYNDLIDCQDKEYQSVINQLSLSRVQMSKIYGLVRQPQAKTDAELKQKLSINPSITISGFDSGYTGIGTKAIIPSKAKAKVDIRLGLGQDPEFILKKIKLHFIKNGFSDIKIKVTESLPGSEINSLNDSFLKLVLQTAENVYHAKTKLYPVSFGTGPIYLFKKHLKVPVVSTGVGWINSNAHGPNESIRIEDYRLGIYHLVKILQIF
ncbi:M20/M25/M40 family metallo-hydrolase [Loigolactobacillus binensis]|uniref:M20/M25/M40 family metallo-hydrolase n=1 Tax=Loigolactobacillus binensis TaxID=2559922 RepID=A0ABW3EFS5_9LACO|nr:M20/M25/M40 family metallo-hydrolase [Loigolactobacillus binensis]